MIHPLLLGTAAAVSATAAGFGYASFAPGCSWFGPVIRRGETTGPPRVALTFDDGPTPGPTGRILDLLNQHDVPACFFCIGRNARAAPDLLRAAHGAGHLLANHSYDHARHGAFHGRRYWVDQLQRTNTTIADAVGRVPRFFRPPMGIKTPRILYAPRVLGMHTVAWTHRGYDARGRSPARIASRLTRRLVPGAVLLMHDGAEPGRQRDARATIGALPRLIDTARDAGFTFTRLDELLMLPGYADSV